MIQLPQYCPIPKAFYGSLFVIRALKSRYLLASGENCTRKQQTLTAVLVPRLYSQLGLNQPRALSDIVAVLWAAQESLVRRRQGSK
ncbi:hypothetical protein BDZ91DRAFT_479386 [Kalaharituber pfeilii]|nr:hypothetical protein BDZ91DRAFT_479386 [Kalaharituber pfeilii]